jgi:hypothetical protein
MSSESDASSSDPLGRHEFMDRASVLISMLDMSLGTHPGIDNGRLCELVDNARNALSDLYQEAASIAFQETSRETETAMQPPP